MGPANRQSPEVLKVAIASPFPHCFMHPLTAFLNVCLPHSDHEQALLTCGEAAIRPHRISILAVVTFSSRPTYTFSINLQIPKYILLGYFQIKNSPASSSNKDFAYFDLKQSRFPYPSPVLFLLQLLSAYIFSIAG